MIRVAADGTLSLATTAQILVEPTLLDHAVELRYQPADPFAVTLCFVSGADPDSRDGGRRNHGRIVWLLDRAALGAGHAADEECGDVRVTRVDALGLVFIELAHGTAAATLIRFSSVAVDQFLTATHRAVPLGTESLDVDRLVREILGSE